VAAGGAGGASVAAAAAAAAIAGALEIRGEPGDAVVVAIDGYGASGKSTIASVLAGMTRAAVLPMDGFFRRPDQPDGDPDLADYYDVSRVRLEGLERLRAGEPAVFRAWDWETGAPGGVERVEPARVVLLDGVFSSSSQLADLVDLSVFVAAPEEVRLERLHVRIPPEDWDERWLEAERRYFATRPPDSFDLVVEGMPPARSR
jgi:uridine kinase